MVKFKAMDASTNFQQKHAQLAFHAYGLVGKRASALLMASRLDATSPFSSTLYRVSFAFKGWYCYHHRINSLSQRMNTKRRWIIKVGQNNTPLMSIRKNRCALNRRILNTNFDVEIQIKDYTWVKNASKPGDS